MSHEKPNLEENTYVQMNTMQPRTTIMALRWLAKENDRTIQAEFTRIVDQGIASTITEQEINEIDSDYVRQIDSLIQERLAVVEYLRQKLEEGRKISTENVVADQQPSSTELSHNLESNRNNDVIGSSE